LELNGRLHTKVIGQDDAIDSVVAVLTNRTELLRQNQSIASFLFIG
jgi:ATP-dependent Clp protease ATP-binding subunit ClpA